jgi:hypothetical protein
MFDSDTSFIGVALQKLEAQFIRPTNGFLHPRSPDAAYVRRPLRDLLLVLAVPHLSPHVYCGAEKNIQ